MKRPLFFIGFALLALLSCSKDEEPPTIQYSFSDVNASPNFTSCVITCSNKSIDDKQIHARLLLSEAEGLKDATTYPIQVHGDTLICSLTGLSESTSYYFGFEIYTSTETYRVKDTYNFKTWESIGVRVTTFEVTNITGTTATGGGNITIDGNSEIIERGLCWSTNHNPNQFQNNYVVADGLGSGWFSVNLTGLAPETTYYVKAYARLSNCTVYGDEISFTTLQLVDCNVSVSANPNNGGTVSGEGTYQQGESCTVTATANSEFSFVNWTEDDVQVSANEEYTFTVNGDRNLVANFSASSYIVSAVAEPEEGGTVSGSGGYEYGDNCTLKAIAYTGYTFEKWTENGTLVSSDSEYAFTVTGNRTLKAHFKLNTYTINVLANPSVGGTVSGGDTYQYGQFCVVTATANNGYTFVNWTEDGNEVSTNADYSFSVTNNRTLVANFTYIPQNYIISVSANPSDGGTVSGGGIYQQGQSCTVSAIANTGFTFLNWTENGNQVSTNANYTFTVTGQRTLVANFNYNGGGGVPAGAIIGLFTINANGDQVYFSQGNLQYQASTNTWRFAENQWDYVGSTYPQNGQPNGTVSGSSNHLISPNYSGWIDLFGWGTSGYNHGAVCYQPWSTSNNSSDFYAYGGEFYHLYDQTGQADWGYNAISNGGNQTNLWRTLTADEWNCMINTRNTTSNIRYAFAQVNDVCGMIILPDDWNSTVYSLNNSNVPNASYSSNVISATQWQILETNGAVFLPAAGWRWSLGISCEYPGEKGCYWSASYSTYPTSPRAYVVYFDQNGGLGLHMYPDSSGDNRFCGNSVRLVKDYNR